MLREATIGWDIGGANLKAALVDGGGRLVQVLQLPCPLWEGLDELRGAMEKALQRLGGSTNHAVTMTGEMVDLFRDRTEGVRELVKAVQSALDGGYLSFYAGAHGFLEPQLAAGMAMQVASANWYASAELVARRVPSALFIDVGSTTTDIAVIAAGQVEARGDNDAQRLALEELLYTGVVRTPVMAITRQAPFEGEWTALMAENFATTADVHRLTGQLHANADQHPAADGGEKTAEASARRLARMIGRDFDSAPLREWRRLARWLARTQLQTIERACARAMSRGLLEDDAPVVGAGTGRFLVVELAVRMRRPYRDFVSLFAGADADPEWISSCAPAVAVAYLRRATSAEGQAGVDR
jgi:probable H4MPT-linked C1 transfer pathway protein